MLEREKEFNFKMTYFQELQKSMKYLSKSKKVVFIGQAVKFPGTAMYNTLAGIDKKKLIELPVAEEMQMGMSLGLSIAGFVPVSIYPRWNFLILGANQLINHIDKIKELSNNQFKTQLIIRTAAGSKIPLDPQSQHKGDFTDFFKGICKNIRIVKLTNKINIFREYKQALNFKGISLMVEYGDNYNK
jgi:pyruvate/2-oxoglutarate/acetoin dehydrogenase E1 component